MQEYYVAFSIHNTHCFITANIRTQDEFKKKEIQIGAFSFTRGQSRTTSERNAVKLIWDRLAPNGKPLTAPEEVLLAFHQLRKAGWKVDDKAFIKRHNLTPAKTIGSDGEKTADQIERIDNTVSDQAKDDAMFMEGVKLAATRESLPFRPSQDYLDRVEKNDPALAAKLRTMPINDAETAKRLNETPEEKPRASSIAENLNSDSMREKIRSDPDMEVEAGTLHPEAPPADFVKDVQSFAENSAPPDDEMPRADDKPKFERLDGSVHIIQGDITKIETDVIVNAANEDLIPGGGVDGAINRAAGPKLSEAMRAIGGTVPGNAVTTEAFDLPAKFVVHAVGPIYKDYNTPDEAAEVLESAYRTAFLCARQCLDCTRVTVPLLSTGVYGYPMAEACRIALATARTFNAEKEKALDITFVAFDDAAFKILSDAYNG